MQLNGLAHGLKVKPQMRSAFKAGTVKYELQGLMRIVGNRGTFRKSYRPDQHAKSRTLPASPAP
jgi:hypothetical protein